MKRFILIAITFLVSSMEMYSQVFTVQLTGGDRLFFCVTDSTKNKVEIVRAKATSGSQITLPSGNLEIPSTVSYKGTTYFVMSIGEGAFANAIDLTSVSIPSSVGKIGEKAFSGCSSLANIVFPSCKPGISDSAFENCKSLSSISFGSDWTTLDLQLFSSSDSLKTVFIPARTVKITGIKQLPGLQMINVDPNNKAFSSYDGMLYSKDGLTFFACPRARSGEVAPKPGTGKVLEGAFNGCSQIESIVLPESVHEFPFDVFEDCSHLSSITLSSVIPPVTAKWNGSTVFSIKSPGENCTVFVPKEYRARYQNTICSAEGAYETLSGNRKGNIGRGEMMSKSTVKKVKRQK